MSLPDFAVARLTRMRYVRFALDHERHTAQVLNVGPQEAVHSSANGLWILAQLEPFQDLHRVEDLPGLALRLMGQPFNTTVVYEVAAPGARELSVSTQGSHAKY